MRTKRKYYSGRIGYKPCRRVTVRKNRWSSKSKIAICFILSACFVLCSVHAVRIACALGHEQCRKDIATKLGQEVDGYVNGSACDLLVKCSDSDDNTETFVCNIMPGTRDEEITSQVNHLWQKKEREVGHTLSVYKGSSVIWINQHGASSVEDADGDYNFEQTTDV